MSDDNLAKAVAKQEERIESIKQHNGVQNGAIDDLKDKIGAVDKKMDKKFDKINDKFDTLLYWLMGGLLTATVTLGGLLFRLIIVSGG